MRYKNKKTEKKALSKLKLGHLAAIKRGLETQEIYNKNPKICLECSKPIPYDKRKNKFCSSNCSACYYNRDRKVDDFCENCGKPLERMNNGKKKYTKKYCNVSCRTEKYTKEHLSEYVSGRMSDERARDFFRRINTDKKCSICGITEWNGKEAPLVVDHIDGNHKNNFPDNLRYVCCNCDALLPTYKGGNKGHGRPNRK